MIYKKMFMDRKDAFLGGGRARRAMDKSNVKSLRPESKLISFLLKIQEAIWISMGQKSILGTKEY